MFLPDVPVIPGHNRFTLWAGPDDGTIREIQPGPDGHWPVLVTPAGTVYVYRDATGRYEYEPAAVQ